MSSAGNSQANQTPTSKPMSTFEFTKRKRWADILITGLTDVIIFILSPEGTVLYCGTAITELLGWSETDIIDLHLNELINVEDQANFQRCFEDSIRTNHELLAYIRLKSNTAVKPSHSQLEDVLFEIKGYPHLVTEQGPDCKCFFAMAKPYPSRNVAMLNTFLEEQMQNERLQQRLASLKARLNLQNSSTGQASTSMHTNATYPTSSFPSQYPSLYDESKGLNIYDNNLFSRNYNPEGLQSSVPLDDVEEGSRKKKLKRAHGAEQYVCVTCGRTDSPEWRKGPLGPKTLCNACGLRWAKQMRKFDEPNEGASQTAADGSNASGS